MCRFLAYLGKPVILSELITKPEHSLIHQSYRSKETLEPLNGDGFGVGWYVPEIDPEPALYTSLTPAWGNINLQRLAGKVQSSCVFAHIRAATPGLMVSQANCHPFQWKHYLFMHNGKIENFSRVRRLLKETLADEIYNFIEGTTDSEVAFGLFLNHLEKIDGPHDAQAMEAALRETIAVLDFCCAKVGIEEPCFYNFAVTNGESMVFSRYISQETEAPNSLYYALGSKVSYNEEGCLMEPANGNPEALVVSSEPLVGKTRNWHQVPENHMVRVEADLSLNITRIEKKQALKT